MEILNYVALPNSTYEQAIFDVSIGPNFGIPLCGFGLYKSKQGNYYIKSPTFKDKRINTEKPYVAAMDLSTERGKDFCKQVLELLKPYIEDAVAGDRYY